MFKDPVCGMRVDGKTSVKFQHGGQTYHFCGAHCLKRFAAEKGLSQDQLSSCLPSQKTHFYKNRLFVVFGVLAVLIGLSYFFPILEAFRRAFFEYWGRIWWAIVLGLFLGGLIDRFIPRTYVSYYLAGSSKAGIFSAVILGFLMSACSHGILAIAIELHKKGASTPAVVAFLLASPWANMTMTVMLFGFFGLKAFYIVFCAIFVAISTGLIFQVLEKKGLIEKNKNILKVGRDFSVAEDLKKRFKAYRFSKKSLKSDAGGVWNGTVSLSQMVLWWILIGMGLASLAGAYIPNELFRQYMGPTILGLLVTLGFATILEVCSEGSSPMAFEIFRQTGAFGNSFVFLMAGVATDYTEIGLLWHNVGRKTAIWLPVVTVPQVIALGLLGNKIF